MSNNYREIITQKLKPVRGSLSFDNKLAKYTWFKVGGKADVFFIPEDEHDLCQFLDNLPRRVPVTVIGNASNLIIRDGGISGVVIRLGSGFSGIKIDGSLLKVGGGTAGTSVARKALLFGLGGLEFLSGIPGTIGGALNMNAGAYGNEMKDIFSKARVVDKKGVVHHLNRDDIIFSYRSTNINPEWIISEVELMAKPVEKDLIAARMEEIAAMRTKTQPIKTMTGGSTFKNPRGYSAWQLIQTSGCKGLKNGGASISNLHCNFLINNGQASAKELEGLGEEVRQKVFDQTGLRLEWEIQRVGNNE